MPENIPLIFNPAAGSRCARKALKAVEALDRIGWRAIPVETGGPGAATALAASFAAEGWPLLAVAGGDGTVNEVVNGIAGTGTGMAIIPTGTANVLARELGVPMDVRRACRVATGGERIRIDLGRAGGRYFTLMAGIGFDALVIKNLNPALKKAIRHAAFPVSGLKTFIGKELPLLRIDAGDLITEGYFVIAANSRYYGGRFGPTPAASMTDGLLDICVLKEKGFIKMIDFWYKALKTDSPSAAVEYFRTAALEVTSDACEQVLLQVDGEVAGELPVRISVASRALEVCIGAGR